MQMFSLPWRLPLRGRDPHQPHRVSTPLELFFDLTFVVAVASNAAGLHHALSEGHLDGLLPYAMVFFAIWWAWASYTWFASAYDTQDVLFRVMTFIIMAGVLVLAAGIPRAMEAQDFRVIVIGYVLMRVAMIPLWLRVAHDDPPRRRTALTYAVGIVVVQSLWIARALWFQQGEAGLVSFGLLALAELALPLYALRSGEIPWHPHHIAERFGLFTIIVLGEVLLANTQGISAVLDSRGLSADLLMLIVGAFLIVVGVWWLYFKAEVGDRLGPDNRAVFNYVHFLIFGSLAALGAGLGMMVDLAQHEAHLSTRTAEYVLAGILAVYVLSLSFLHGWLGAAPARIALGPVMAVTLLLVASLGLAAGLTTLLFGLILAGAVLLHQMTAPAAPAPEEPADALGALDRSGHGS